MLGNPPYNVTLVIDSWESHVVSEFGFNKKNSHVMNLEIATWSDQSYVGHTKQRPRIGFGICYNMLLYASVLYIWSGFHIYLHEILMRSPLEYLMCKIPYMESTIALSIFQILIADHTQTQPVATTLWWSLCSSQKWSQKIDMWQLGWWTTSEYMEIVQIFVVRFWSTACLLCLLVKRSGSNVGYPVPAVPQVLALPNSLARLWNSIDSCPENF